MNDEILLSENKATIRDAVLHHVKDYSTYFGLFGSGLDAILIGEERDNVLMYFAENDASRLDMMADIVDEISSSDRKIRGYFGDYRELLEEIEAEHGSMFIDTMWLDLCGYKYRKIIDFDRVVRAVKEWFIVTLMDLRSRTKHLACTIEAHEPFIKMLLTMANTKQNMPGCFELKWKAKYRNGIHGRNMNVLAFQRTNKKRPNHLHKEIGPYHYTDGVIFASNVGVFKTR